MPVTDLDVITEALAQVRLELCAETTGGTVADYIPQLSQADPDWFGLALASMDGHSYRVGDADVLFTIQSVSKPFVYGLALAELGPDELSRWVAAEPSGEAFNAISLQPGTGRPANPMINAGAIVTTGLVPAVDAADRFERIRALLSAFAGRELDVDEQVYESERATGDRNRALAYLMRSAGTLPGAVEPTIDTYFRQCAVRVSTADLAMMAATLANGGAHPVTAEQVVPEPVAVQVLAVMATCGMYDVAGDWLVRVGLPAKSGVSGGVIAVSPARFGVAAFSPPLDSAGSSVRAVAALRTLSRRFGMHVMHAAARAAPTVTRTAVTGRAGTVVAQGGLDFPAAERIIYALAGLPPTDAVVCDLTAVTMVEPVAEALLTDAFARLVAQGRRVAVASRSVFAAAGPWQWRATMAEALAWAAGQG
jgi:glutaminase